MKLSWFVKELMGVLIVVVFSISFLIWALVEASDSSGHYTVFSIGFISGFVPIIVELIIALRNGTFFLKDKEAIAAKKARNVKQARFLFVPAVAFGIVFALFPSSIKVFLLSALAGYLLPYSIALLFHFIKNHKEIKKIAKDI